MSIRRVITILSGSDDDAGLLRQALPLCQRWGAGMDALFVRRNVASGADFLGNAFSTYGMEAVLEALDDAAAQASLRAHEAFEAVADDAPDKVMGRYLEFVGLPGEAMAVEGRLCDLVMLAKPDEHDAYAQLIAIEAAARESGRPVLVLPAEREARNGFERVVIAWDGSLEAARAVSGAMPMLDAARSVHVVHAGSESGSAAGLGALARYLELHGVSCTTESVDPKSGVPQALRSAADDATADLFVMGGFGAPGWQRAVGRDETTALLKQIPFAILLAH